MERKYEFTGKTMQYNGHTLHRIRALRTLTIPSTDPYFTDDIHIDSGNIGGWIESEDNLSHDGNCWVDHDARVYGHASVRDNAYVGNETIVCCATIADNARVLGDVHVDGDSVVFNNATIDGCIIITDGSKIYGNAGIVGSIRVSRSEIYGKAFVTGTSKIRGKKLCKSMRYEDDDLRNNRGCETLTQHEDKKYEFTGETMEYDEHTLHRIRALRTICIHSTDPYIKDIDVREGDLGGWIDSEDALSHEGSCWVSNNAKVYEHASVKDDAYVGGEAIVCCSTIAENARVCDNAIVKSHSEIYGHAMVVRKAQIHHSEIYGGAEVTGGAKMYFQKLGNSVCYSRSQFGDRKYEFTGKTMQHKGYTLHQIRAVCDLCIYSYRSDRNIRIQAGDIGGWINSEDALSHEGNCWVADDAKVYGDSPSIRDNAYIGGNATVCGATIGNNAIVIDDAEIIGFVRVGGSAIVAENAVVKYESAIGENATIMGTAVVEHSKISGNTTIGGDVHVYCKTLNKGLYKCEDDFREEAPPPRTKSTYRSPVDFEALEQAHGELCMGLLRGY